MPYALTAETGHRWATERSIDLFVAFSGDLVGETLAAVATGLDYFDLPNDLAAQVTRTVPFTPAIPALYGHDAALDELLDEVVDDRRSYYQQRMTYLDGVFADLGLEPRVAPESRSRSVRSLPLPDGLSYDELHDAMKAEVYIIYGGLGEAAKTSFRVCALGASKIEALEGFAAVLQRVIARGAVAVA